MGGGVEIYLKNTLKHRPRIGVARISDWEGSNLNLFLQRLGGEATQTPRFPLFRPHLLSNKTAVVLRDTQTFFGKGRV